VLSRTSSGARMTSRTGRPVAAASRHNGVPGRWPGSWAAYAAVRTLCGRGGPLLNDSAIGGAPHASGGSESGPYLNAFDEADTLIKRDGLRVGDHVDLGCVPRARDPHRVLDE
jgi:hypothetical protein